MDDDWLRDSGTERESEDEVSEEQDGALDEQDATLVEKEPGHVSYDLTQYKHEDFYPVLIVKHHDRTPSEFRTQVKTARPYYEQYVASEDPWRVPHRVWVWRPHFKEFKEMLGGWWGLEVIMDGPKGVRSVAANQARDILRYLYEEKNPSPDSYVLGWPMSAHKFDDTQKWSVTHLPHEQVLFDCWYDHGCLQQYFRWNTYVMAALNISEEDVRSLLKEIGPCYNFNLEFVETDLPKWGRRPRQGVSALPKKRCDILNMIKKQCGSKKGTGKKGKLAKGSKECKAKGGKGKTGMKDGKANKASKKVKLFAGKSWRPGVNENKPKEQQHAAKGCEPGELEKSKRMQGTEGSKPSPSGGTSRPSTARGCEPGELEKSKRVKNTEVSTPSPSGGIPRPSVGIPRPSSGTPRPSCGILTTTAAVSEPEIEE